MSLYVEDASKTILPGLINLAVLTKSPAPRHGARVYPRTWFVSLAVQADTPPTKLLQAFAAAGFVENTTFRPASPYPCPTSGVMVRDITLAKSGSGLFNGWTAEEEAANVAALRRVISAAGLRGVSWRHLTLAEQI